MDYNSPSLVSVEFQKPGRGFIDTQMLVSASRIMQ